MRFSKNLSNGERTRVFILGAGSSVACDILSASGLLDEVISYSQQHRDEAVRNVFNGLLKFYFPYYTKNEESKPQLDEFITLDKAMRYLSGYLNPLSEEKRIRQSGFQNQPRNYRSSNLKALAR